MGAALPELDDPLPLDSGSAQAVIANAATAVTASDFHTADLFIGFFLLW
jgi:hypothetical protein